LPAVYGRRATQLNGILQILATISIVMRSISVPNFTKYECVLAMMFISPAVYIAITSSLYCQQFVYIARGTSFMYNLSYGVPYESFYCTVMVGTIYERRTSFFARR